MLDDNDMMVQLVKQTLTATRSKFTGPSFTVPIRVAPTSSSWDTDIALLIYCTLSVCTAGAVWQYYCMMYKY